MKRCSVRLGPYIHHQLELRGSTAPEEPSGPRQRPTREPNPQRQNKGWVS